MCRFCAQNDQTTLNENFSRETINIILIYFRVPCKFIIKSLNETQNYDQASFLVLKWLICPKKFFQKNHHYNFHVNLDPFYCGKLK